MAVLGACTPTLRAPHGWFISQAGKGGTQACGHRRQNQFSVDPKRFQNLLSHPVRVCLSFLGHLWCPLLSLSQADDRVLAPMEDMIDHQGEKSALLWTMWTSGLRTYSRYIYRSKSIYVCTPHTRSGTRSHGGLHSCRGGYLPSVSWCHRDGLLQ